MTTNELMKMVPGTRAEYANGAIAIYMKSGTVIFEHEIKVGKISVFHRDHEAKYNIHYNDICITENLKNFCSPIIVAGGRYYKIHTLGGASDEPLTVSCEQVTFTKIER